MKLSCTPAVPPATGQGARREKPRLYIGFAAFRPLLCACKDTLVNGLYSVRPGFYCPAWAVGSRCFLTGHTNMPLENQSLPSYRHFRHVAVKSAHGPLFALPCTCRGYGSCQAPFLVFKLGIPLFQVSVRLCLLGPCFRLSCAPCAALLYSAGKGPPALRLSSMPPSCPMVGAFYWFPLQVRFPLALSSVPPKRYQFCPLAVMLAFPAFLRPPSVCSRLIYTYRARPRQAGRRPPII